MIPSFFIAHGSPMMAVETDAYTDILTKLGQEFPKPKAIVIFSAHNENSLLTIGCPEQFSTIYDLYGFPDSVYKVKYPAKTDFELAKKIASQLDHAGIECAIDRKRGLDHGAWTVLMYLYPNADIPVISMSVSPYIPPEKQYAVGKALQQLKDDNVLIIGSGNTIHNFQTLNRDPNYKHVHPWALEFEKWIEEHTLKWDLDAIFKYDKQAPSSTLAVPTRGKEHFSPFLYLLGTGDSKKEAVLRHRSFKFGSLSYTIWEFK